MKKNLYDHLPDKALQEELFDLMATGKSFKLERIVSSGEKGSPETGWYDQDCHEWVILLSGSAGILFEENQNEVLLEAGDYLHIHPHQKHRVTWTNSKISTVWLALYYEN